MLDRARDVRKGTSTMAPQRPHSSRDRRRLEEEEEAKSRQRYFLWGGIAAGVLLLGIGVWAFSGHGKPMTTTSDPEVKTRLEKLFKLYKSYVNENRKGPANAQALKDYYAKLPAEEKAAYGDNVDTLFVNPRDGAEYVVRYGVRVDSARSEALIWEKDGKDGNRYVALTMGYVALKPEDEFKELRKQ